MARNRWRERIHPIKGVTHSHIEPHQQPRYRENATLRRSGRTRSHETRSACLPIQIGEHTYPRACPWKGHICIECIVRSPGLPTPIDTRRRFSCWRYERSFFSHTNRFRNLLSVFEHSFERHYLIDGDTG